MTKSSIKVSRSSGSALIEYAGFNTATAPMIIDRRVGGGDWVTIATPSEGDGAFTDDAVSDAVECEYRCSVGDDVQASTVKPAKSKVSLRAKPVEAVAVVPPAPAPNIFDPWGILDDISDNDPQASISIQ